MDIFQLVARRILPDLIIGIVLHSPLPALVLFRKPFYAGIPFFRFFPVRKYSPYQYFPVFCLPVCQIKQMQEIIYPAFFHTYPEQSCVAAVYGAPNFPHFSGSCPQFFPFLLYTTRENIFAAVRHIKRKPRKTQRICKTDINLNIRIFSHPVMRRRNLRPHPAADMP